MVKWRLSAASLRARAYFMSRMTDWPHTIRYVMVLHILLFDFPDPLRGTEPYTLSVCTPYYENQKYEQPRKNPNTQIRKNLPFFGALVKFRKSTMSFDLSLRPSAWNNSARTEWIFVKFDIWVFLKNLSRKFKFHYNLTTITCTLRENVCIFMIMSRWIFLRMRNVWDKICRGN
jgi:hypothetical protein